MITYNRLGKCGRLGNQLWQIASTIGIARTLGQSVMFDKWDYRPFFKVPDEYFGDPYVDRDPRFGLTLAQNTPQVEHIPPVAREYLQDYGLWKDIESQVWSWFQPSDLAFEILYNLPQYEEFVALASDGLPICAVHIRRGDNAKAPNNCHPVRPRDYYLEEILNLWVDNHIMIFSDDPEWCRKESHIPAEMIWDSSKPRKKEHERGYAKDPFNDWIDLQMMSMCQRHVISNSTYAWWGAFLSHDPAPIYPWPFFGPDLDYIDTSLMFPDNWVRHDHGQQYSVCTHCRQQAPSTPVMPLCDDCLERLKTED